MKARKWVLWLTVMAMMWGSLQVGLPVANAQTSGDYVYSLSDGQVTITDYTGKATTLIIPSTLSGYPVMHIGEKAFANSPQLSSVTIPSSVLSIEALSFGSCTSLKEIFIPNSVLTIGAGAFSQTPWFNNQPNGLVYAGLVAYRYKGLMPKDTNMTIKDGTKSISSYAFGMLSNLKSIIIPGSVMSIGNNAFVKCTSLTRVIIPSGVKIIGDGAFSNCSSLASITIPSSVNTIDKYTFFLCPSLISITILNGVENIGESAFNGCTSLVNVTIPKSVRSIGKDAFGFCSSLMSISVDENNPSYSSQDGVLYNKTKTTLIKCPDRKNGSFTIPSSVKNIGKGAFTACTSLTNITIPFGVTIIDEYGFNGCTSIKRITIPDSVTTIGKWAFNRCESLSKITIPESVIDINEAAFSKCSTQLKIYGDNGSYAQAFAKKNKIAFIIFSTIKKTVTQNKVSPQDANPPNDTLLWLVLVLLLGIWIVLRMRKKAANRWDRLN